MKTIPHNFIAAYSMRRLVRRWFDFLFFWRDYAAAPTRIPGVVLRLDGQQAFTVKWLDQCRVLWYEDWLYQQAVQDGRFANLPIWLHRLITWIVRH